MKKIIAFDLDGTLCKSLPKEQYNGLNIEEYLKIQPIKKNIRKVQYAKQRGYKIAIHSSRHWALYEVTRRWLNRYSVPFDFLILGKYLANCYIDNKGIGYRDNFSMKKILDSLEKEEENEN